MREMTIELSFRKHLEIAVETFSQIFQLATLKHKANIEPFELILHKEFLAYLWILLEFYVDIIGRAKRKLLEKK